MAKKIVLCLVVLIALFLGYASTRPSAFRYERSAIIEAPQDKIFPFLSNFQLGSQWSPYEEKDLNMKKNYSGEMGAVGSKLDWAGNSDVGAGVLEIMSLVPNESVDIKLTMKEPMEMSHMVRYRLTPEANGTRFTWSQEGENGLFGKIMTIVVDCDKLFGKDMEHGIEKLKKAIETP